MSEDTQTTGIGKAWQNRLFKWFFDALENLLPEEWVDFIKYSKTKVVLRISGEFKKKETRERNILFEEELAGAGFPIKSLNKKSIEEALLSSFSLTSLGPIYELGSSSNVTVKEFIDRIVDNTVTFHVVKGESGSGKTVFALTLALKARSIRKGCYSFYLRPTDFDSSENKSLVRIKKWAGVLKKDTLIVIVDALNETIWRFDKIQSLVQHLREIKVNNLKFVLLYRDLGSGVLSSFATRQSRMCGENNLNYWMLPFSIDEDKQCATIPLLLNDPRFQKVSSTKLLKKYEDQFSRFKHTRGTALELFKYYQRKELNPANSPPSISPWSLVFSNIIGNLQISDQVLALCRLCFGLLETGRFTDWVERADAIPHFQKFGLNPQDCIVTIKEINQNNDIGRRLRIEGGKFRFPDEMHIHVLAGIWIAYVIKNQQNALIELSALRGRSTFNNTARFVLPACELITCDSAKILHFINNLGSSRRSSYSFCAHFLTSDYGQVLDDTETEQLKRKLFGNLIIALDGDRAKSCDCSIKDDMPEGPNPIVDQLFEVSNIYGDDAVDILINSVLLDEEKTPTARSQGAYLLLDWLEKARGDGLIPINKYLFLDKITNGIKTLSTWNLHIRFHILELLEFLFEERKQAGNCSNQHWAVSLDELARKFSHTNYEKLEPKLSLFYKELNSVISNWAGQLVDNQPNDALKNALADYDLENSLNLNDVSQKMAELNNDFELSLECVEVSLGLARRKYCNQHSRGLESYIMNTEKCKFWIIRWWGFYNLLVLVSKTNNPEHDHIDWLLDQLLKNSEPVGLKKRQCTHLLSILPKISQNARKLFSDKLQSHFEKIIEDAQLPGSEFRNCFTKPYKENWDGDPYSYLAEYFQGLEAIFDYLELADLSKGLVDRNLSALV